MLFLLQTYPLRVSYPPLLTCISLATLRLSRRMNFRFDKSVRQALLQQWIPSDVASTQPESLCLHLILVALDFCSSHDHRQQAAHSRPVERLAEIQTCWQSSKNFPLHLNAFKPIALNLTFCSLVNDLRHGTVNENMVPDSELRAAVQKRVPPQPEDAAVLEAEFRRGFEGIVPRVFPGCEFVQAVCTGTMLQYVLMMEKYAGEADSVTSDVMLWVGSELCVIQERDTAEAVRSLGILVEGVHTPSHKPLFLRMVTSSLWQACWAPFECEKDCAQRLSW